MGSRPTDLTQPRTRWRRKAKLRQVQAHKAITC